MTKGNVKVRGPTKQTATVGHATDQEPSPRIGRLLPGSTRAAPLVDFDGNAAGPIRALTTISLDPAAIDRAIATGQGAVLVFENGDPLRPIVTGLIQPEQAPSPLEELLLAPRTPTPTRTTAASEKNVVEARLDGQRVILEGTHEVTLKCGDASITLRRDGKVIVRGAYVETHARGVNRIKGGAVKIN